MDTPVQVDLRLQQPFRPLLHLSKQLLLKMPLFLSILALLHTLEEISLRAFSKNQHPFSHHWPTCRRMCLQLGFTAAQSTLKLMDSWLTEPCTASTTNLHCRPPSSVTRVSALHSRGSPLRVRRGHRTSASDRGGLQAAARVHLSTTRRMPSLRASSYSIRSTWIAAPTSPNMVLRACVTASL